MRQADPHPQDGDAQWRQGDRLREVRRDLRTGKEQGMSVVASPPRVELRLKQRYQDKIVPALIQRFAYTNVMQVPAWSRWWRTSASVSRFKIPRRWTPRSPTSRRSP